MARSTDELAERFVRDGEIQTAALAKTLGMSAVTGALAFLFGIGDAYATAVSRQLAAYRTGVADAITRYFEVPAAVLAAAAESTAAALSPLGVLAYPVATVAVAAGFYAVIWGVTQLHG